MKKSLIVVVVVVVVILLTVILTLALCPEKKPEAKPNPPQVNVYVSPLSAISPVNYNVRVNVVSEAPLRKVRVFFEGEAIFERDIDGDTSEQGENFSLSITGGRKFADISLSYTAVMTGAPGKIVSFLAQAEDEKGIKGEGKKEVIIFENKPCDVRVYIVSPQGTPIGLPPFSVQIGASVSDDRCGAFNHASGTTCKFRFIWDADNKGGEFSPDGETEQPLFAFTYQELGVFTPRVKVIDDGGNECESRNPVPVFVAQKIDNITVFEKLLESPKISVIQHDGKTKLFISRFIEGLYEYSVSQDGTFIVDDITRPVQGVSLAVPKKTDIGDFLLIESPDRVFLYPISGSVRWGTPLVSLERTFTKSELISFSGRVTFLIFFVGNFLSSCFFIPERELFGEVCLNFELSYNFSLPYAVFTDEDDGKLYFAHFIEDTAYDFVLYSFPLTFDELEKLYVLDSPSEALVKTDFPPSELSFFKGKDGRLYLVISTSDQIKSASYRMYFFDVRRCIGENNCSPLTKEEAGTYIRMNEFISDIPSEEICAFSGLETYYINVLDYILLPYPFSGDFSFCSPDADCILSLLCLDEVGGRKCVKNAFYPFLFLNSKLRKNLKTNCIPLEYDGGINLGQRSIIHAWETKGIFDSGKFIFSIDFSGKKAEIVDSESYFVDPVGLSGYKDEDKLIISRGGIGGIDILEFNRDGEFIRNSFHLYVRPQGKWADLSYSIPFHYLDKNILIAVLQKPGCGEPENFSGLFIYDMEDMKSLSMREYKFYRSLNQIGIHSISSFAVRKRKDALRRWNVVLSGTLCQQVGSYILSFSLEKDSEGRISFTEISRIKLDEGNPESFYFVDDDKVVFSTQRDIYILSTSEGKIIRKVEGEGGGKLFMYRGVIYEFVSDGGYLTIKTFDTNLNKIRDFPFYIGIYPSVSKVYIARVIDEFFGFGELDFAFVGLSSPELLSNISALLIFDVTNFVRNREDIEIFAITPGEFYIGARDFLFFRTGRNMVFLLDFSGAIARVFLR